MIDIDDTLLFNDDELAMLSGEFTSDPAYSHAARHYVFVYGTMRHHERNHERLHRNPKATFVGMATTARAAFRLMFWGNYRQISPVITFKSPGKYLRGELYDVRGPLLRELDACEGYPSTYDRIEIPVETPALGRISAFCYMYPVQYDGKRAKPVSHDTFPHLVRQNGNVIEYVSNFRRSTGTKISCKTCKT